VNSHADMFGHNAIKLYQLTVPFQSVHALSKQAMNKRESPYIAAIPQEVTEGHNLQLQHTHTLSKTNIV